MLSEIVLYLTLVFLFGVSSMLAGVVTAARGARNRLSLRRSEIREQLRPAVLELTAGEPDQRAAALARLSALGRRHWLAVAPTVLGLLHKVKGEAHHALAELLEARGELRTATTRLQSRSMITRARAAELLGTVGRAEAVPQLVAMLDDRSAEVRQVAARALGRIGAPDAIGPLLATIGRPAPVPPRLVAMAVANTGLAAHPELDRVLREGSPAQRAVAAEVCGLVGASSCLQTLCELIADDPSTEVRIKATRSVGRLGLPWVGQVLIAATATGQPAGLRAVAARALGDVGHEGAAGRLAELAVDADDRVAVNASQALLGCGPTGLTALRTLAESPHHVQAREALLTAVLRRQVLDPPPWIRGTDDGAAVPVDPELERGR